MGLGFVISAFCKRIGDHCALTFCPAEGVTSERQLTEFEMQEP